MVSIILRIDNLLDFVTFSPNRRHMTFIQSVLSGALSFNWLLIFHKCDTCPNSCRLFLFERNRRWSTVPHFVSSLSNQTIYLLFQIANLLVIYWLFRVVRPARCLCIWRRDIGRNVPVFVLWISSPMINSWRRISIGPLFVPTHRCLPDVVWLGEIAFGERIQRALSNNSKRHSSERLESTRYAHTSAETRQWRPCILRTAASFGLESAFAFFKDLMNSIRIVSAHFTPSSMQPPLLLCRAALSICLYHTAAKKRKMKLN